MVSGRRVKEEEYYEIGRKVGLIYKGGYTGSARAKILWECETCGATFEKRYDNVKSGQGCPVCSMKEAGRKSALKTRKPLSEYIEFGNSIGLEYLSGYPCSTVDPVMWRCVDCGEIREISLNALKSTPNCQECNTLRGLWKIIPEEQYHELAKEKGIVFAGGYTESTKDNVSWFCPVCKNEWQATYSNIKQHNGCPQCSRQRAADKLRLPESAYYELAENRGLEYLGGYTGQTDEHVKWRCLECNTVLELSYNTVYKGSGCSACSSYVNGVKASKIQIAIAEMMQGEVNYQVGSRYIDIALVDKHIAIEFDCWYWHGDQIEKDRARAQEIIDAGWQVLAIKGNSEMPTKEQIDRALEQLDGYGELVMPDWGVGKFFNR